MESNNNNIIKEVDEKEEISQKNIQKKIQNTTEVKQEKESKNKIEIKKPIISQTEYQNMIKKRNLMMKNSKYKPIKLLFGKDKKQTNQNQSLSFSNSNINTNIQINNYTTYLTTSEAIAEEKYQKDGKTLMVESPLCYSVKKLNYKSKNEEINKIMIIYIKKINEIEDIYNFTNEYLSFIINLFAHLCQPYISTFNNLFVNCIKPNLKYFQKLVPIFQEFSNQLKFIEDRNIVDANNNPESNLINSVKQMNLIKSENCNKTSTNIQNIIINNKLYIQLDTIESKFIDILYKMKTYIDELINWKKAYNTKYQNEIDPIFKGIKQRLNDSSLFYDFLTQNRDFIFIEKNFIFFSNSIYNKISQFLINIELLFKFGHTTFCDYLELLHILVKSFYEDNKNIMDINTLLPKKLIINIDKICKSNNIRKQIEKRFEFSKVIENIIGHKLVNEINHSLLNYRDLLTQYNYIKSEEIEEIINFNLIKYKSSDNFIQFLMRLIPEKFMFKFNDMIELKMDIKRNTGMFSIYKNSLLIITYQGHIFLFDKDKNLEINKKKEEDFNATKRMTRKDIINSIIVEDENKNEEINKNEKTDNKELYEVLMNNKITEFYPRRNFGMSKLVSNQKKNLMYFYEHYMNYKQFHYIIVDLLSEDNMNYLINTIAKNKFV